MAELKNLTERIGIAEGKATLVKKEGGSSTITTERKNSPSSVWSSAHLHVNNNNNALDLTSADDEKLQTKPEKHATAPADAAGTKKWKCESCEAAGSANVIDSKATVAHYKCVDTETQADVACAGSAEDKDKGGGVTAAVGVQNEQLQQNGTPATPLINRPHTHTLSALAAAIAMPERIAVTTAPTGDGDLMIGAGGAASLTPPDAGGVNSNRTSVNNSTENLSYSSDNYYPDDLILIDDDEDADAEEISLNSDDCVYAYRGDGADFDLGLDAMAGRGINSDLGDDEPDFLEMDFEPDPLSEIEYGGVGGAVEMSVAPSHADAFLMQRDSCHLSGRHSANMSVHHGTQLAQRPLFSSPNEDVTAQLPSLKTLQSQALLNQNFACITLHLDKIKSCGCSGDGGVHSCYKDGGIGIEFERASALGMSGEGSVGVGKMPTTATAHSLPTTLHSSFGRDVQEKSEKQTSPSKITGAKPKRLVTFSNSSSTSSKNSSKSRTSLRSAFALPPPTLCASSSSFDERRVSCTEFRGASTAPTAAASSDECVVGRGDSGGAALSSASVSIANAGLDQLSVNDETCLDCLEKEFVASTIGKAMAPNECPKCRKRSGSLSLYKRAERETRCRSGSPTSFFTEAVRVEDSDSSRFDSLANNELLSATTSAVRDKRWDWKKKYEGIVDVHGSKDRSDGAKDNTVLSLYERGEQAATELGCDGAVKCYNLMGKLLPLSTMLFAEPEVVTIPTINLTEEALVQALNKLHVGYNPQLIKTHFNLQNSYLNLPKCEFESLKHMLLYESKKPCNYLQLKRLIELATLKTVVVEFKKDTNRTEPELVSVKVADIIYQWTRNKNLATLKQLDQRFSEANILGKIANIIRQSEQRGTPRQPLPEFITIPQYYPSGYLTLTKNILNNTKR